MLDIPKRCFTLVADTITQSEASGPFPKGQQRSLPLFQAASFQEMGGPRVRGTKPHAAFFCSSAPVLPL